jgi:hypothetical protein
MKRVIIVIVVCLCALAPTTARADDGGWLDWLYHMDTTFWGLGTDFHLRCLDKDNQKIDGCEHMFGQFANYIKHRPIVGPEYGTIKQEHNLRLAYYWSFGRPFPDAPPNIQNGEDLNAPKLMAIKAMYMYVYHFNETLHASAGAGFMPIFTGAALQPRGVFTPISIIYGPKALRGWYLRYEYSYLSGDFNAAEFGATGSSFDKGGEWNQSFAVGLDLRRLAHPAAPRP